MFGRGEPSTLVQDVRTPSGMSNLVPFVIPGTMASSKIITPQSIQKRLSGSSGCSDTSTPPGSPLASHSMATQPPNRVNYFPGSAEKKVTRTNSFSHARCRNCNSQFIVKLSPPCNSTRRINGEFCSGECRCSFLASAIDQQYCRNKTSKTFVMSNSSGDDMDSSSSDDEW